MLWIIGAEGVLGSTLGELCKRNNIYYRATGSKEGDVTSLESLLSAAKAIHPTHIVNCAAFTDVDQAEQFPQRAFAINEAGAGLVAKVAHKSGAKLVHISTDYVFAGTQAVPYCEGDECSPVNVYGRSKWEGEKRVFEAMPSACVIRASWFFGKKGKNFISSLLQRMREEEVISVVADQSSCLTYCWDLADIVLKMLDATGIFHFANSGGASRFEIAQEILTMVRKRGIAIRCEKIDPVLSSHFPSRAKRPAYSVLDTHKISQYLGKPPRSWQEAFNEYLSHV